MVDEGNALVNILASWCEEQTDKSLVVLLVMNKVTINFDIFGILVECRIRSD